MVDNEDLPLPSARKRACPETWRRNKNQNLRNQGKIYVSTKKSHEGDVSRSEKLLGPPCGSPRCGENFTPQCPNLSVDESNLIFKTYWSPPSRLSRRVFVCNHVTITQNEGNIRPTTKYELTNSKSERIVVCKKTFLVTLFITDSTVLRWALCGLPQPT